MLALGLSLDVLPTEEHFEVWEENAEAVEMFLRCSTQWRVISGMVIAYVGLDYNVLVEVMRICGIVDIKATLDDVMVMERAALAILNKPSGS